MRVGDVFLVQINVEKLIKFKNEMGVSLLAEIKMKQEELEGENHILVGFQLWMTTVMRSGVLLCLISQCQWRHIPVSILDM